MPFLLEFIIKIFFFLTQTTYLLTRIALLFLKHNSAIFPSGPILKSHESDDEWATLELITINMPLLFCDSEADVLNAEMLDSIYSVNA